MSTFSGLFVRHYMGQTPQSGNDGWSGSPDVIFAGTSPLSNSDLSQLGTTLYNKDFGSTVYMNQQNYVYMRALNTTGATTTGRMWFYYTESDLALWPGKWRSDCIKVQGIDSNYETVTATAGAVAVTQQPLIWTPPPYSPGHSSGDHYCVILWGEDPQVNPPVPPVNSVPNFNTWQDLANFVSSHPNVGFRNTQDITQNLPTQQWSLAVTGPQNPGQVWIGIQCNNMPTDGFVSYNVPGLLPPPSQKIPISFPNMNSSQPVTWPGSSFATSLNITYWQGATVPPAGASITPVVFLPATMLSNHTLSMAVQNTPYRLRYFEQYIPEEHKTKRKLSAQVGGNIPGLVFGSTPLMFRGP